MSIISIRHLAEELQEEQDLLEFLTGSGTLVGSKDGGERNYKVAQMALFKQYPNFDHSIEPMHSSLEELAILVERCKGDDVEMKKMVITGWMCRVAIRLGGMDPNAHYIVSSSWAREA